MKFCAQQAQFCVHLRNQCALKKRIPQPFSPFFCGSDFKMIEWKPRSGAGGLRVSRRKLAFSWWLWDLQQKRHRALPFNHLYFSSSHKDSAFLRHLQIFSRFSFAIEVEREEMRKIIMIKVILGAGHLKLLCPVHFIPLQVVHLKPFWVVQLNRCNQMMAAF